MKTLKIKPILILNFILVLGLTGIACEGSEGPTGPQGPQGEQGTEGPQGEKGAANVIYSEWMDIAWNQTNTTTRKSMLIEEPRVLGEFQDHGTVLVFLKVELQGDAGISPLPLFLTGTAYLTFSVVDIPSQSVEGIGVVVDSMDDTTPVPSDWSPHQLRYVLIPGGLPAKMANGFFEDYEAVADYFGFDP